MTDRRRTFGRVAGLGVAAAVLAAVAGSRPWLVDIEQRAADVPTASASTVVAEMPSALALALVVLAAWGVMLVARGLPRRLVALVALLGSVGLVVSVVVGRATLRDTTVERLRALGGPAGSWEVSWSPWFWVCAVASVASVVATALAVAWSPSWPEMGRRYDAPDGAARVQGDPGGDPADASALDLWKALDEGRDPTAGSGP